MGCFRYIDSIPSHLLRFLVDLEEHTFQKKDIMVYIIVNNGFYEGKQNRIVIEQMKHWCKAVDLKWGQAIGIGAGEMLPLIKDIPLGYGPQKILGTQLISFQITYYPEKLVLILWFHLIGHDYYGEYNHQH